MFQLSLVIYLSLGLHVQALKALISSFDTFPVLSLSTNIDVDNAFILTAAILGKILYQALIIALPMVLVCFLVDIAFGLLNRVAPQINACFLSLPMKTVGGLAMFFFLLPFLVEDFVQQIQDLSSLSFIFLGR